MLWVVAVTLVTARAKKHKEDVRREVGRLKFDDELTALGRKAVVEHERASLVRSMGLRQVDTLGVQVGVGCALIVREGNATVDLRSGDTRRGLHLRTSTKNDLEGIGPFMCRLRQRYPVRAAPFDREVAFVTSVSDASYLWKYWRWILNKLCVSTTQLGVPYYLFVGAPNRGGRRETSSSCPARIEESLAHTTKALSLYLGLKLRLARRLVFLDADIWFTLPTAFPPARIAEFWSEWLGATKEAKIALPAPCYKQFFGAAVVAVRASDWTLGFLQEWYDLRCGPKDQPSLWSLVFRTSGLDDTATRILDLYHDPRCVNQTTGELTKNDCSCKNCGYYAAWKTANSAFLSDLPWTTTTTSSSPERMVEERDAIFEVSQPLFTPGGNVAYLPNAPGTSVVMLCGAKAPLRHVKWLRKNDRELPITICGRVPEDVYFKGPRDAEFT